MIEDASLTNASSETHPYTSRVVQALMSSVNVGHDIAVDEVSVPETSVTGEAARMFDSY